eukprot:scaffold42929_cov69-Phaeocystis_antarctica.AAC.8
MSRLSLRRNGAAAFHPARNAVADAASVGSGRKQRRQGWETRRAAVARGLAVGFEQQFHNFERRPLGGSVVQGKLLGLSTRRAAQHRWAGRQVCARRRGRTRGHIELPQQGAHRAARLIRCGCGLGVGVEQQLYHLERCALGGSVVQGQLHVLRGAVRGAA